MGKAIIKVLPSPLDRTASEMIRSTPPSALGKVFEQD